MTSLTRTIGGLLAEPRSSTELALTKWEEVLRAARRAGILGTLGCRCQNAGMLDSLPVGVRSQLADGMNLAASNQRAVSWEVNRIHLALSHLRGPVVLLKGAAYLIRGLPIAHGRLMSDVDVLVPKSQLVEVEAALLLAGWQHVKLNAYDQRYYRKWMHELPPLRYPDRDTYVDLHHGILPRTGKLRPDPKLLIEAATQVPESQFWTLNPVDMVLHCAAHLFHDGAFEQGLRDLVDLRGLFQIFGTRRDFWTQLVPRAVQLSLERPLFYAIYYCHRLLASSFPPALIDQSSTGSPNAVMLGFMNALIGRSIQPIEASRCSWDHQLANALLYLRSHYLRMPMHLLVPHLTSKFLAHKRGQG